MRTSPIYHFHDVLRLESWSSLNAYLFMFRVCWMVWIVLVLVVLLQDLLILFAELLLLWWRLKSVLVTVTEAMAYVTWLAVVK